MPVSKKRKLKSPTGKQRTYSPPGQVITIGSGPHSSFRTGTLDEMMPLFEAMANEQSECTGEPLMGVLIRANGNSNAFRLEEGMDLHPIIDCTYFNFVAGRLSIDVWHDDDWVGKPLNSVATYTLRRLRPTGELIPLYGNIVLAGWRNTGEDRVTVGLDLQQLNAVGDIFDEVRAFPAYPASATEGAL